MATKYKVNWNLDFGKNKYREGDEVTVPDNQVEVLLKCGVITPVNEATAQAAPPVDAGSTADSGSILPADELAKLSKAMLAEYAKEKFSATLDPVNMTKDAMLAAIAEAAAKAAK